MGFDEIEQIIREKTIHDPEVKSLLDKIEKGEADVVDRCKLYMRQLELPDNCAECKRALAKRKQKV